MKLNDDVYVLPIATPNNPTNPFNLSLILDSANGPLLVDTGIPGQTQLIAAALAEAGVQLRDLTWIILTHQDIDHIGSLHEIAQLSRARVLAHDTEAPAIDGTVLPRFARPEVLAQRPEMRPFAEMYQPTPIDQRLTDGEQLERAGGIRVVFTPGHTPGHISLYLERSRTLIAGDALTASDGQLQGPNPAATPDMDQAAVSVRKLAELDVAAIVCYHGGVVREDANGQLRRLAQKL